MQCVDITFAEPSEVEEVTKDNCFNSSDLSYQYIVAMGDHEDAASSTRSGLAMVIPLLLFAYFAFAL